MNPEPVRPLEWTDEGLRILDQTALPAEERYLLARTPQEVGLAIQRLAVRGAPLLGIVAAYGLALAAERARARTPAGVLRELEEAGRSLIAIRPTAVNVAWAVGRVCEAARAESAASPQGAHGVQAVKACVLAEARSIALEDQASCEAIGRFGSSLIPAGANVLTHCNTGALATGGDGTAQGVIVAAHREGKRPRVWVGETRPVLQGARLTAWELQRLGIPMTLVADTAAGSLMARGLVDLVIVGADRIASNGDTANKLGTYQLAVLAAHHAIPFYVAAPASTVDMATANGASISIEDRDPIEVTAPRGVPFAPEGTPAFNPAFDVTPAALVAAIITDRGVVRAPYGRTLRRLAGAAVTGVPA